MIIACITAANKMLLYKRPNKAGKWHYNSQSSTQGTGALLLVSPVPSFPHPGVSRGTWCSMIPIPLSHSYTSCAVMGILHLEHLKDIKEENKGDFALLIKSFEPSNTFCPFLWARKDPQPHGSVSPVTPSLSLLPYRLFSAEPHTGQPRTMPVLITLNLYSQLASTASPSWLQSLLYNTEVLLEAIGNGHRWGLTWSPTPTESRPVVREQPCI